MTTAETTAREVGKARARKEDARLITGQTNWTDNIILPGLTYVAFVRSPYAHARITGVDLSAAREASGVIAVFSGADFAAEQGSLPCAWPVTEDIVLPDHPAMAVDTVRYAGEIVAAVVARDRYAAADAVELIDVSYEPLEPVLDMEAAVAARLAEGARGGQQVLHLDAGQRRHGRGVPRRARGARAHVPAAAADPVGDGAARRGLRAGRRRVHDVDLHPDPAHPQDHARPCHGHPRAADPGDRSGRGRRLRLQAPGHGRRGARAAARSQARPAGEVDRDPVRGQRRGASRQGPDSADQDRRGIRRAAARARRRPARGHGRVPDAGHARRAAARRVHVQRDLQDGRLPVQLHGRVHHEDADRRLPRRRPPRGDVRHRAHHGRPGRRARHGPARGARAELDQARGVPVHHDRRADLRLGELRGGDRGRERAVPLRGAPDRTVRTQR